MCGSRAPYYIDQRVAGASASASSRCTTIKTQLAVQLGIALPLLPMTFPLNGRRHGGRRRNASGRDAGKPMDEIHERFGCENGARRFPADAHRPLGSDASRWR